MPELPAEPIRGRAVAQARRVGGRCWMCRCGNFHVLDQDSFLAEKWAATTADLDEVLDVESELRAIIDDEGEKQ
jgi:hypothetical protein